MAAHSRQKTEDEAPVKAQPDEAAKEELRRAAAVARDVQARAIFNRMAVQDARDVGRSAPHPATEEAGDTNRE